VREKLTPQYGLGCKRPSFSNKYLPSFNRDNVHLETDVDQAGHGDRRRAPSTAPTTSSTS
jgi:cation diffusion facilitator CzcD-associated flavoprotein CzcO